MTKIIEIKNLKKSFGRVQALKSVTFDLARGEVVGFIGPNGAGKSTTIRILLGVINKEGGEARIFGQDTWQSSYEIHKRISYVPGEVSLWGNLTGGEIIDIFMKLHGSGQEDRREHLIERFALDPKKKAKSYSKGNRQKVGLISALAVEAELYIFDEPTSGLDPLLEQVFQEEVKILKDRGKSILLSSHILSEVERLADRVVIIRQGEIVESGSLEELRHLTRSRVTLELNADVNFLSKLAGIHDFTSTANEARFSLDNDLVNDLLKELARLDIKKIEINPPTLEDLFIRHYREDEED